MTETKTPVSTPSPSPVVSDQPSQATANQGAKSPGNAFMVAVLGMSWQLAIVVLVPIVGGFELDKVFATSPLLVIGGFIVAMAGFALIVRRQLQLFSPPPNQTVQPTKKGPSQ